MGAEGMAREMQDYIKSTSRGAYCLGAVAVFVGLLIFLGNVLTPFLIAALLAYLMDPVVRRIQKCRVPRVIAVVIVFILLVLLIGLSILVLVPLLQKQLIVLFNKLPDILLWAQSTLIPWAHEKFGINLTWDVNTFKAHMAGHWQQAGSVAAGLLKTITSSSLAIVGWVTNIILIPVVFFYLLRDWSKLVNGMRHLLPRTLEPTITRLVGESNSVLGAFFRGQLMVMIGLGILYGLGLSLIGLDTALAIGFIAGLLSIVPYLGFIVGIISAMFAAYFQFHDWWHIAGVGLVFVVAQSIEGSILTPWLVGDRVGLHPVLVIFSILAGGQLFGFIGVLLAIPVTAVLMVFMRYMKQRYLNSTLYAE